jgi:hypothetical protein
MEEVMVRSSLHFVLVTLVITLVVYKAVPALAQDIDRSAPPPRPPERYKVTDNDLRNIGIARGTLPALPNKCYGDVSISDEFLERFREIGFSLETICLAISSPWVQFHPETGMPLKVSEEFLLEVPQCFKNGKPFLDCKFNFDHASGWKLTDQGRQHIRTRAIAVDEAVRSVIASGRYVAQCRCGDIRWGPHTVIKSEARCRFDFAPACLEQISRQNAEELRAGALVPEINGFAFEGLPTKGATDYGDFDISPRLLRGYAYRIGSPEGDDDTPYVELPPGRRIGIGVQ